VVHVGLAVFARIDVDAAGEHDAVAAIERLWKRVARTILACPADHAANHLELLNEELLKSGVIREPMSDEEIWSITDIHVDSKLHYHKKMTEIYIVLEGEGYLEADGEQIPLKPLTTIMIRPGCVHRAVGKLRIINVPMPPFDPADEFEV